MTSVEGSISITLTVVTRFASSATFSVAATSAVSSSTTALARACDSEEQTCACAVVFCTTTCITVEPVLQQTKVIY
jgi:hypothetical protein